MGIARTAFRRVLPTCDHALTDPAAGAEERGGSVSLPADRPRSLAYSYFVVGVLTLIYTFNFLDRKILSILAELVRRDLNLTDTQLGILSGFAFALFYTTLGIPLAWLADRTRRTWIIAAACTVWSLFTALCGMATSFVQLALFRFGVAAGEAGGGPPSFSIISDYFPPERRGTAMSIYALGVPIGLILGSVMGGWIAATWGWRWAFVAVGAPGLLLAVVLLLFVREPVRGGMDPPRADQAPPEPALPLPASIALFLRNPVLVWTAASSAGTSFIGNAVIAWAPAYLMRTKGMEMTEIAIYYSVATGVAGAIGSFGAGWLVDRWAAREPRAYALVPGIATLVSIPFFLGFLWAPSWPLALAFLTVPFLTNSAYLAPALTVVQNNVPAAQRGISSAILMFLMTMVGMSGGPLLVGLVSDRLQPTLGPGSLTAGLATLTPLILATFGAHMAAASFMGRRARAMRMAAAPA